jgi:hypothetical protein
LRSTARKARGATTAVGHHVVAPVKGSVDFAQYFTCEKHKVSSGCQMTSPEICEHRRSDLENFVVQKNVTGQHVVFIEYSQINPKMSRTVTK